MSDRSARTKALGVGAFVLVAIAVNVVPRVVGAPDVDLPALPDLPGWVHVLLKVKNLALAGLIVAAIALAARHPDRD